MPKGVTASVNVDALGVATAPSAAMSMTYVSMADSIGLMMANAVTNQQGMQTITNTAVVQVVAMILAKGAK